MFDKPTGFAVMFILVILLVMLGIWSKVTNNAIMGFIVENFDLSMAIGFISVIVLFILSYALSVALFRKKYA
jgi:ABC-type dipeptide/oligopeptide/nickel transport system permease component